MDSYAGGGLRLVVGTDAANWKAWAVGGKLVPPNPYGGWQNNPIDPSFTPYEYSYGTPPSGTSFAAVGSAVNLVASIFKGNPHQCDAIRYGRAEARFAGGQAANYATFSGFATVNDYNDAGNGYNRWGLIQSVRGGFLWKGLITIGYGALCDFRDSNKTIYVQDTRKVASSFNKIVIQTASTNVLWEGISIVCVSPTTTASKGELVVSTDVVVAMTGCQFIDMNTFTFMSNSTLTGTTFRRCALVTQGGATFTNCTFENATGAVAILSDDIEGITGCDFVSDGTGHAIELTSAHAGSSFSLTGCSFTGYAATGTPGSSGNEVIYNNSGGAVTITTSGVTGTVTYMNGSGASTTVVSSVPMSIKVQNEAKVAIENAQTSVYLLDSPYTELMNEDTLATGYAEQGYTGSYPVDIVYKVRKSETTDDPRYIPFSGTGKITEDGFSAIVTLKVNPFI